MSLLCPYCSRPAIHRTGEIVKEKIPVTIDPYSGKATPGYVYRVKEWLEPTTPVLTILKGENAETGDNDAAQGEYHG